MRLQFVFIAAACVFALLAIVALARAIIARKSRSFWAGACWASLSAGMFLQGLAPNLEIDPSGRGYFVIPDQLMAVPHAETVSKEKRMKLGSAIFTLAGCVGLVVLYGGNIVRPSGVGSKETSS